MKPDLKLDLTHKGPWQLWVWRDDEAWAEMLEYRTVLGLAFGQFMAKEFGLEFSLGD